MTVTFTNHMSRAAVANLLERPVRIASLRGVSMRPSSEVEAAALDIHLILDELDRLDRVSEARNHDAARQAEERRAIVEELTATIETVTDGGKCQLRPTYSFKCSRTAVVRAPSLGFGCRQHMTKAITDYAERQAHQADLARWTAGDWTPDEQLVNEDSDLRRTRPSY